MGPRGKNLLGHRNKLPNRYEYNKKIKEKEDTYGPLLRSLQLQYPGYRFSFIPIIIGATGYLPNGIEENLAKLGFTPRESKIIVGKCQMATIGGTVKISKTFMGFRT
ncbi:hypothetical protein Ahia01_000311100 [Argonauta hians]